MDEKQTQASSDNVNQTENINPVKTEEDFVVQESVPDIEIPTLRTYKSDINQTVHKDKISTAKILIAEQNKKKNEVNQNTDTSIKRPTNIIVLIISIILIVSAILAIGLFGYKKVVQKEIESPQIAPSTFLFVFDQQKYIDTSKDAQETRQVFDLNSIDSSKSNTYIDFIFYKTNGEEKTRITTQEFLNILDIKLPTNIGNSLGKDFVYGGYVENNKIEPFLILSISQYELLFGNMLNWESTLVLDVKDIFPNLKNIFNSQQNFIQEIQKGTSTLEEISTTTNIISTSTEIGSNKVVNRSFRFVDFVLSNTDVRVVRDDAGNIIFYYGFITKNKIIFAQDPKIIGQIKQKLKEKSLVR